VNAPRTPVRWIVAASAAASAFATAALVCAQDAPADDAVLAPIRVAAEQPSPEIRPRRPPIHWHRARSVAIGSIGPGIAGYLPMLLVTAFTSIDPICAQSAGGYVPIVGPLVGMIASRNCPNYAAVFVPDFISFVLQFAATSMVIGGAIAEVRSNRAPRTAWAITPMGVAGGMGLAINWTSR
jgi:hypothetical protein